MLSDLNNYYLFLFAGCRMAGLVFFNPIYGRRNIPAMIKVGLALGLALNTVYGMAGKTILLDYTAAEMALGVLREITIGFAMGFVIHCFMAVFHMGGELMDLQMGISMAMMFDPSSNSQISISGNLLTILYTLLFFITNSHITLAYVAAKSFQAVPVGLGPLNGSAGIFFAELFGYIIVYAVQLALPVIATELLVEIAVGILMRVVPNINVFVVNLQLKLLVGIVVLFTITPMLVRFLGKLNQIMLEKLQTALQYIA